MAKWVLVAALPLVQLVLGGIFWDWETRFLESPNLAWFVLAGVVCCAVDARIIWLVDAQHADDATRDQKWTAEMERRHLVRGKVAEPAEAAEKEAADLAATRLFNGRESIEVP
jgi:hypothetical protein